MRNKRKTTREKNRKKRRGMLISLAVFVNIYLILSFFFGEMGFFNALRLQKNHLNIQKEVIFLVETNERLKGQIEALRNDLFAIERHARERLGFVKQGEWVYEFLGSDTP
ncbi:MAG: septum formation initiator family protein [Nitrospiria bacterium]